MPEKTVREMTALERKHYSLDDLQEFILFMQNAGHLDTPEQPLSAKTIRNVLNMIHKALDHAVGRQLTRRRWSGTS